MKTITYNPETHVLVPREPSEEMIKAGKDVFCDPSDCSEEAASNDYRNVFKGMIAAAPQPEQVESEPVYQVCMADSVSLSGAWIDVDKQTYHDAGLYKEYKLRSFYTTPQPDRTAELEQLRQQVAELEDERDAALARLSEERDIWDGMLGNAADKIAHLELELDDCLHVLDALWDKQCNKIVTQKWAEILIRNKRDIGALSADDSCQQSTE